MNTAELIAAIRRKNSAAERQLFDLYAGRMLMVCRRYVKSPEDGEELMLDGFYKFYKNIASFHYENDGALYSWLKRIMINECLMFLRKKNVFTIVTEAEAEGIALQEALLDNLSAGDIFNLIVQLPVGYRTVFNLFAVEGFNHKEIAALLRIAEGTSKSQLSKAKILLQKMLYNNQTRYDRQKLQ